MHILYLRYCNNRRPLSAILVLLFFYIVPNS